jgi:hypothetical protein
MIIRLTAVSLYTGLAGPRYYENVITPSPWKDHTSLDSWSHGGSCEGVNGRSGYIEGA